MRKKWIVAAMFMLLCMFKLPIFWSEAEAQVSVSENAASEFIYNEEFTETLDLMVLDWKKCTDEAISHAVMMKDWYEVGMWLTAMSTEEREELLARDTDLKSIVQIQEDGYPTVYEYALDYYEKKSRARASYPRNSSGYWTTTVVNGATSQSCSLKIKVSGIDKDAKITESQSITITPVLSGTNWCGLTCTENSGSTYALAGDSINSIARARFSYTKPAGYVATVSYSDTSSMHQVYWDPSSFGQAVQYYFNTDTKQLTNADVRRIYPTNGNMTAYNASTYSGSLSLVSIVNILRLAGIGSTGTTSFTGANLTQTITLMPITYNVNYNGNGATSGGVAAQNCSFGKVYTTQNNGYSKNYTITYNGNGGTPAVASQTAKYTFKGWGNGTTAKVTHAPGTTFGNLTTTSNGVINMYAIWNPASITLASAERKGYQFTGWNIGKAGAAYTPVADVTAVAAWSPNTYEIELDANSGVFLPDTESASDEQPQTVKRLSAIYDTPVSLPQPIREGYSFGGWIGENGIYQDSAENVTSVQGEVVQLKASWTAEENTMYTIKRYKQSAAGADNYKLFDEQAGDSVKGTEVFYGATDSIVTVPAVRVEGYETPDDQMIKISGDGSTVVYFYYRLNGNESHYAQNNVIQDGSIVADKYKEPVAGTVDRLAAGLSVSVVLGGEVYEVVRKEDGTLTIMLSSVKSAKLAIPETMTVNSKTYRITEIGENAFRGNEQIQQVIIPGNISKIGKNAFAECRNLKTVVMKKGVLSIGDSAFSSCKKLKNVTCGEELLTIGNKSFYKCSALSAIKIPKTVITIGNYAFAKCTGMKKVTFASRAKLLSMGKGVFSDCKALKKIKLPSKLATVPPKAFINCKKLKTVTIGKSVTEIGKSAFYNCKALKKVTIKTEKLTRVGSKAFKKCKKGMVFVVPALKKMSYRNLLKGKW